MQTKKLISFALSLLMLLSCMITVSAAPTWTGRFSEVESHNNTMISGMREKYPDAEIYLMTFPFFQTNTVGSYCDIVEQTAATYDCTFVDLYRDSGITSSNVADHMVDGFLHPNYAGMDKITDCLVDAMLAE